MNLSKEKMRLYMQAHYRARREEAIKKLGGCCAGCGTTTDLQFDHKDPATKTAEISAMWRSAEAKFEAELAKCQLLCLSCHKKKSSPEIKAKAEEVGKRRTKEATVVISCSFCQRTFERKRWRVRSADQFCTATCRNRASASVVKRLSPAPFKR